MVEGLTPQRKKYMFKLLRTMLRLSVVLALFCLVAMTFTVPYFWVVDVVLVLALVRRKPTLLWYHGTARFAVLSDLKGMTDVN